MLERPHYSKTVEVNASVIKRKLKPRHHSFSIDADVNLELIIPSVNSAREYNLKIGEKYIYSVMVIFYGKTKDGFSRNSSTPLITIASSNDYIMRHVEKALNKLKQSDAMPRFMRIVYDIDKDAAQKRAEKKAEATYASAKMLDTAKSFGFSNYADYLNSLRKLNKILKHGATQKTLEREAKRIAKEKERLKRLKEIAKAKAKAAAKAATIKKAKAEAAKKAREKAKRQAERLKRMQQAEKAIARQNKAIAKNATKLKKGEK